MNSYIYPYLLNSITIDERNKVWATDYTYIKLNDKFVYLTAYIDIYSRYIVGWGLFETLEAENSLEVLWRSVALYGRPQIINTDQGSQYVCWVWEAYLKDQGIQISMNRKATPTQNIYIERFWHTLKYSRFFRRTFASFDDLERTIGWFVDYYNHERLHLAIEHRTPASVYGVGVGNFVGSGYFYRNFDITHEQALSKAPLKDLLQEICRCYVRHNFRPEYREGYIFLHFGLNQSVCQIVKVVEYAAPLSSAEIEQEMIELQQVGKQWKCWQFRLLGVNGFQQRVKNPAPLNLVLSDCSYLEQLRSLYHTELFAANESTYAALTKKLKTSNRVAVVQATGTGKSLLIARFVLEHTEQQVLVVAPSNLIIRQIKKHLSFRNSKNLCFTTYASLARRIPPQTDYLVLDEFHRCGATQWSQGVARLMDENPSAKILGTSATPIRHSDHRRNMADELFDGRVVSNLTLAKAMAHKILPVPTYVSGVYSIDDACSGIDDHLKLEWECSLGVPALLQKHLPEKARKIIVFCKNIDHLKQIEPLVEEWFGFLNKPINIYQLHNHINFRAVFRAYETPKADQVDLLLCVDMLNEGVHTPEVDAVVMLRDTASPTLYQQQLGRCMSVSHDKTPVVFDLVNNFKNVQVGELIQAYERERRLISRRFSDIEHQQFIIFDHIQPLKKLYEALSNPIETWDMHYKELIEFHKANGHTLVPHTEAKLNQWCLRQRKTKKDGKLHDRKVAKLNNIGFVWDYLSYAWLQKYEQLQQYASKNGHPNIPKSDERHLHEWCCDQRKLYRKGKLDPNRRALLEQIGFAWDALSWLWDRQLAALDTYRACNGHCNVSALEDPVLASWVLTQRMAFKANKLSEKRRFRLDAIGFDWTPLITTRTYKLKVLEEHLQQIQKSRPLPKEKKIYDWYQKQKLSAKEGSLSSERLEELRKIGLDL